MKKILVIFLSLSLFVLNVNPILAQGTQILEKASSSSSKDFERGVYSFILGETSMEYYEKTVYLHPSKNNSTQKFVLSENEDGTYTINCLRSGFYLTLSKSKNVKEAEVTMEAYSGKKTQNWIFKEGKKNKYTIRPAVDDSLALHIEDRYEPYFVSLDSDEVQEFEIKHIRDLHEEGELESSIDVVRVDKESDKKGNFNVKIEKAESNGYVSGAYFEVTPQAAKDKTMVFYEPAIDGNINCYVHARDFDYVTGKYDVNVRLLLDGQFEAEVGTFSSTVNDPWDAFKEEVTKYLSEHVPVYIEDWQLYLRDIKTGKEMDINSHQSQAASMIKMFVAGCAYDDYERLCDAYKKDYIDQNLHDVITASSNEAWMRLIEAIGDGDYHKGHAIVTEWANNHGYPDVYTAYTNSMNFCSSKDTSQFFKDVYDGKLSHSEELLDFFKHQEFTHKIPQGVPEGIVTGNKTGDLGSTENDTCIVYAPHGTYILCMMSTGLGSGYRARCTIREVSKIVYDFLNS